MKFIKTEGIIINKFSLRDADQFITIFTPDHGKIVAFARGVRNITSKRISKLGFFSHIKFEIVQKQDRKTLTHVELINSYRHNKKNLQNISRLFQIGEIIDGLLPENEKNERVYFLLIKALDNLHRFKTPEYLRRFKIRLLEFLGYGYHNRPETSLDNYIESLLERRLKAKTILT